MTSGLLPRGQRGCGFLAGSQRGRSVPGVEEASMMRQLEIVRGGRVEKVRRRLRTGATHFAGSLFFLACSIGYANVTGEGDVSPMGPIALPIGGGVAADDVIVGDTDLGILTIDAPAFTDPLESDNGVIGLTVDGLGRAVVAGFDLTPSEWRVNDVLTIGEEGVGVLEVLAGARVYSNFNSTTAGSNPDMIVGSIEGSQGFVTVSGFGSLLRNEFFSIGEEGHARVEILDFARVSTLDDAIIGRERDSTNVVGGVGAVYVDGIGTRWNIGGGVTNSSGDLIVAELGRGTLEIRNEAWVRVENDAFVGVGINSYGELTVTGENSLLWVEDILRIGSESVLSAQGQLYANDQGVARADDRIDVNANGRVDLAGGTLLTPELNNRGVIRGDGRIETTGLLTNELGADIRNAAGVANLRERLLVTGPVDNSGIIESIGGEMEFESPVENQADGQIFGVDAVFRFRGGLTQGGSMYVENTVVETAVLTNAAALAVGPSSSFVIGDLVLTSSSELDMVLGDDHSELAIVGDASLDGSLTLALDDGFTPIIGDSFRILSADSVTGMFAPEISPSISGIDFDIIYNASEVLVNVIGGFIFSADFDGSGFIDDADLAIWAANLGGPGPAGDANGDGVVNNADFLIWQEQNGMPAPAEAALAAVPEPTSALLLLMGTAFLVRRRR